MPEDVKLTIDEFVWDATGGVVQSGPFAGMRLLQEQAWTDGAICPMLLGCHEQELHGSIESEIERLSVLDNPKIINVGCAEGYYAVGLARRLPKATVWAVDISKRALELAHDAAHMNGVKIVTGATIDEMFASPDLIVMDCEGDEVSYLAPDKLPGLLRSTIIVEIHNKREPDIVRTDEIIMGRFMESHNIVAHIESARDPNKFAFLWDAPSSVRWMAVSEGRPCLMGWFVMRPK